MKPSRSELSQFAPWELETRDKEKPERKGIPPSNQRLRLHTKPKAKDHTHLEMYVLAREKERLEKYGTTLGRRVKSIAATWKEVKSTMYKLQNSSAAISKEGVEELLEKENARKQADKNAAKGKVQKMNWRY